MIAASVMGGLRVGGGAIPGRLTFGGGNSVTGTKQASTFLLMFGQNNRMSEIETII